MNIDLLRELIKRSRSMADLLETEVSIHITKDALLTFDTEEHAFDPNKDQEIFSAICWLERQCGAYLERQNG